MWSAYVNVRVVTTLDGLKRLRLHVRRCQNRSCPRYHRPYRPEAEGRLVLPEPDPSWLAQAMQRLQEPPEPESDQDSAGTNP